MEFKEKLILLRKSRGMSQQELADEIGVSRQAVSKWEVGSASPSLDNVNAISKLYNVSIDTLVNDALAIQEHADDHIRESSPPCDDKDEEDVERGSIQKKKGFAIVGGILFAVCLLAIVAALYIALKPAENSEQDGSEEILTLEELEKGGFEGYTIKGFSIEMES